MSLPMASPACCLELSTSDRNGARFAVANLTLIAFLLELLQQWSTGRHPRVSDALVSALAGMLGVGLSVWLRNGAERRILLHVNTDAVRGKLHR